MYSRLHVRLNNACFVGVHGMQVNGVFSTSYRILRFVSHKTFLYELVKRLRIFLKTRE